MKISLKVSDLLAAIERVSQTVDKKDKATSAKILVDAYKTASMQVVFFYSTNMIAEVCDRTECTVEESGKCLIELDQLRTGLAHRDPTATVEVALELADSEVEDSVNRLRFTIGSDQFVLGYDANGTDVMSKRMRATPFKEAPACTVSGKDLRELVRRAAPCIPKEGEGINRFSLGGMQIRATDDGLVGYGTDGHVCAKILVKGAQGPAQLNGILLPQQALAPLAKLASAESIAVLEGEKNAAGAVTRLYFKTTATTFFGTRLINGQFPDIESTLKLQTPEVWVTVDREKLMRTLQRAGGFDLERRAELEFTATTLIVRAKSHGQLVLKEEHPLTATDLPSDFLVTRVIDLDYLLNAASLSTQPQITLGVHSNVKKAVIVKDDAGNVSTVYAIMPVKTGK